MFPNISIFAQADYQSLSILQVTIVVGLVFLAALWLWWLKYQLQRQLAWATVRMVLQMVAVGFVLTGVFAVQRWYVVLAMGIFMSLIASQAALGRLERRYKQVWFVSMISIGGSAWTVAALGLWGILQVTPWYRPEVVIPILGMILGNSLNGISIGLDRFQSELVSQKDWIETQLTFGATRWEAVQESSRRAVRAGLIPAINTMSITGLVSLPGMMTGQLLSGVHPADAVKYQIYILSLVAIAVIVGCVSVVHLSTYYLTTAEHQLLLPKEKR